MEATRSAELQGLVTQIENLFGAPLECDRYKETWGNFGNVGRYMVTAGKVRTTILDLLRQAMKARPPKAPADLWPTDPVNTANLILGAAHKVAIEYGDDELIPVACEYFLYNLWHAVTMKGDARRFSFFFLQFRRTRTLEDLLDTPEGDEGELQRRHDAAVRAEREFVAEYRSPVAPFIPSTFPQITLWRRRAYGDATAAERLAFEELDAAFRTDGKVIRTSEEFDAIVARVAGQIALLEQGMKLLLEACG